MDLKGRVRGCEEVLPKDQESFVLSMKIVDELEDEEDEEDALAVVVVLR